MSLDDDLDEFFNDAGGGQGSSSAPVTKAAHENKVADNSSNKRKTDEEPESQVAKLAKVTENRAIWVSNLPRDTDIDEISEAFRMFGIIDEGIDGKPRIKMYTDDDGKFNGRALIVYFRRESIQLAINYMDEYWIRPDERSDENKLRVKEADKAYKRYHDVEAIALKMSREDKKASERTRAELNRKLTVWSDDEQEPVKKILAPKKNKWNKICIMKHAFTLAELAEDDEVFDDLREEVREEAATFGEVTNVTIFDKEEKGIISVRFKEFDAAENFVAKCHGRSFAGRQLEVTLAQSRPKFKKSGRREKQDSDKHDSSEEERLAKLVKD